MELVTVVHERNEGWILDRMADEVGRLFHPSMKAVFPGNLPAAKHYFVTHYSMLSDVFAQVNPQLAKVTVLFTHQKPGVEKYLDALNLCYAVVCESRESIQLLTGLGIHPDLLHFIPECGDNVRFQPHDRKEQGVLICQSYYQRKNPELMFQVIAHSKRQFLLLGRNWSCWDGFPELKDLPNFKYVEAAYEDYPKWYRECDVYLSTSSLEGGGPNSLIESMHANLMPVVSDTGNAHDYIHSGFNGLIFPINASPEDVIALIERAYGMNPRLIPPYQDVFNTVKHLTWTSWANQVRESITGDVCQVVMEDSGDPIQ